MTTTGEALLILLAVFACSVASNLDGRAYARKQMRTEAVQHGAAEWVADKEGNVEFKWKTPSSNKP